VADHKDFCVLLVLIIIPSEILEYRTGNFMAAGSCCLLLPPAASLLPRSSCSLLLLSRYEE
jgi:hypothetical protein